MDKNINTPLITVFMAVYNGEDYIKDSIESVLTQTFTDFELLIINDGSTDRTLEVIREFKDSRIRLLSNDGNKGLCYTRNRSVREAKGTYLAILDSDDLAVPNRLELQVNFFNAHPEIALCGGQALVIDGLGNIKRDMVVTSGYLHMSPLLAFHNIFINSTLMIRKSAIMEVGGYNNVLNIAGDYDLSFRISVKYPVANLDKVLVHYRIHDQNMSSLQSEDLVEEELQIIESIHTSLNIPINENLIRIHHDFFTYQYTSRSAKEFLLVFEALKKGNSTTGNYSIPKFNEILFKNWFSLLRDKEEKRVVSLYFKNKLFEWSLVSFKQLRKVFKQMFFLNLPFRNKN